MAVPLKNNSSRLKRGETIPSANVDDLKLGEVAVFPNHDYTTNPTTVRDGRTVVMRLVQNDLGSAILPGECVLYGTAAGERGSIVDALCSTGSKPAGFADDSLPAAGVPNGEAFWIHIEGPCNARNDGNGALSINDQLVCGTTGSLRAQPAESDVVDYVGVCEAAAAASDNTRVLIDVKLNN